MPEFEEVNLIDNIALGFRSTPATKCPTIFRLDKILIEDVLEEFFP